MVPLLRRLDVVQEVLIHDCLAGGRDRPEQEGGAIWVGSWQRMLPFRVPLSSHRLDAFVGTDRGRPAHRAMDDQLRSRPSRAGPGRCHRHAGCPDESRRGRGCRQAAARNLLESVLQPGYELVQCGAILGRQDRVDALDHDSDRLREGGRRQSGSPRARSSSVRLDYSVATATEQSDHLEQPGHAGAEGHRCGLGHQEARPIVRDEGRHGPSLESLQDASHERRNGGTHLSHRVWLVPAGAIGWTDSSWEPAGGPGDACRARPALSPPTRRRLMVRPVWPMAFAAGGRRACRSRPPRPLSQSSRPGYVTAPPCGTVKLCFEQAEDRHVDVVVLARSLHHRLGILPPRCSTLSGGSAPTSSPSGVTRTRRAEREESICSRVTGRMISGRTAPILERLFITSVQGDDSRDRFSRTRPPLPGALGSLRQHGLRARRASSPDPCLHDPPWSTGQPDLDRALGTGGLAARALPAYKFTPHDMDQLIGYLFSID